MNKIIIDSAETPQSTNLHEYEGSIWECLGGSCMFVQCECNKFALIHLATGNRIREPQSCLSKITEGATLTYLKATIVITK